MTKEKAMMDEGFFFGAMLQPTDLPYFLCVYRYRPRLDSPIFTQELPFASFFPLIMYCYLLPQWKLYTRVANTFLVDTKMHVTFLTGRRRKIIFYVLRFSFIKIMLKK